MQYFQFDSEGNMYIFQPGSGFSGPSVKVEAGFEMEKYSQEDLFRDSGVMISDVDEHSQLVFTSTETNSQSVALTTQKR